MATLILPIRIYVLGTDSMVLLPPCYVTNVAKYDQLTLCRSFIWNSSHWNYVLYQKVLFVKHDEKNLVVDEIKDKDQKVHRVKNVAVDVVTTITSIWTPNIWVHAFSQNARALKINDFIHPARTDKVSQSSRFEAFSSAKRHPLGSFQKNVGQVAKLNSNDSKEGLLTVAY